MNFRGDCIRSVEIAGLTHMNKTKKELQKNQQNSVRYSLSVWRMPGWISWKNFWRSSCKNLAWCSWGYLGWKSWRNPKGYFSVHSWNNPEKKKTLRVEASEGKEYIPSKIPEGIAEEISAEVSEENHEGIQDIGMGGGGGGVWGLHSWKSSCRNPRRSSRKNSWRS